MRKDWQKLGRLAAVTPATYWSGGKKIIRNIQFRFPDPLGPMTLEEIGYTQTKMSLLKKSYIHEESLASAVDQWNNRRRYKAKAHWSTGFSTYNHILKSHSLTEDENSIGSVMGPCLQAITITHTIEGIAEVDVFYRTTEVYKKFPADLILIRDHMLSRFDFERTPLGGMTIHVANMTVSPTYIPVLLHSVKDPVEFLEEVRESDPQFHKITGRWAVKLIDGPESSFNQARRTQRAIKNLMTDEVQRKIVSYFSEHYPEVKP